MSLATAHLFWKPSAAAVSSIEVPDLREMPIFNAHVVVEEAKHLVTPPKSPEGQREDSTAFVMYFESLSFKRICVSHILIPTPR